MKSDEKSRILTLIFEFMKENSNASKTSKLILDKTGLKVSRQRVSNYYNICIKNGISKVDELFGEKINDILWEIDNCNKKNKQTKRLIIDAINDYCKEYPKFLKYKNLINNKHSNIYDNAKTVKEYLSCKFRDPNGLSNLDANLSLIRFVNTYLSKNGLENSFSIKTVYQNYYLIRNRINGKPPSKLSKLDIDSLKEELMQKLQVDDTLKYICCFPYPFKYLNLYIKHDTSFAKELAYPTLYKNFKDFVNLLNSYKDFGLSEINKVLRAEVSRKLDSNHNLSENEIMIFINTVILYNFHPLYPLKNTFPKKIISEDIFYRIKSYNIRKYLKNKIKHSGNFDSFIKS